MFVDASQFPWKEFFAWLGILLAGIMFGLIVFQLIKKGEKLNLPTNPDPPNHPWVDHT